MFTFHTTEQAIAFSTTNAECLHAMEQEALRCEGVEYADQWLNGACPSFIAGYNGEDEMVVCFPLHLSPELSKVADKAQ
ncbi:MAG: hypothetical protein C9356_12140 [Oleiphilus sp.]|nr:MAG: hypothetical protein C9356_12140 [Oleiphilus sp.]